MSRKILIFGSQGGLGQAFMQVFRDEDVTGLDRDQVDISDESQVLKMIKELKPNLVINCAAYTAVDKAEEDRKLAELVNGYAPGFIAQACKKVGAVMVHFSTGQVFDGTNKAGYNEDDITNPVNAYGRSKLIGEIELQKNTDQFYLIRTAWLFGLSKAGPPRLDGESRQGKKSFSEIMLDLAAKDEVIKAVEDEFGSPTYTHDLAQATRALFEEHKPYGIYHLVNFGRASRYDWAKEIFRIKDVHARLVSLSSEEFAKRPALRPKYEILNNTKYIQLRPWQEALEEYLLSTIN